MAGGNLSEDSSEHYASTAYTRPAPPPATMRGGYAGASDPVNLADLLERVLDKGIVIAGDVRLFLGGIELLTIKIRLLIASVDKAQEIGINWWESDPALSSQNRELRQQRDELLRRLERVEENTSGLEPESETEWGHVTGPALSAQNRELRQQRDEMLQRLLHIEKHIPDLEPQSETAWEHVSGPALSAQNRELRQQRDDLMQRLERMEAMLSDQQQPERHDATTATSSRENEQPGEAEEAQDGQAGQERRQDDSEPEDELARDLQQPTSLLADIIVAEEIAVGLRTRIVQSIQPIIADLQEDIVSQIRNQMQGMQSPPEVGSDEES